MSQMKVRCRDNHAQEDILSIGTVGNVFSETPDMYWVELGNGKYMLNKSKFEIVEEKEMIKIKRWEDLKDLRSENNIISFSIQNIISIYNVIKPTIKPLIEMRLDNVSKETTLSILKQFGFEVEFVEILKLTEEEKSLIKCYKPNGIKYIARDEDGRLMAFEKLPQRENGYFDNLNSTECYKLPKSLFTTLKWEDEPLFLDDLEV